MVDGPWQTSLRQKARTLSLRKKYRHLILVEFNEHSFYVCFPEKNCYACYHGNNAISRTDTSRISARNGLRRHQAWLPMQRSQGDACMKKRGSLWPRC